MSPLGDIDPNLVIDAVQTLVRVPSVNPSIAPGEGTGEAAVAEAARDWLMVELTPPNSRVKCS